LNDGDGSFAAAKDVLLDLKPRAAGLVDLNGDGHLDAVTSSLATAVAGRLNVLLGDGQGGFTPGLQIDVDDNPHSLAVEDFDGDGRADVAVAHTRTVSLFLSRGDGSFAAPLAMDVGGLGVNPRVLAAADFDRDGSPDLVSFNDAGSILFLRNAGDGRFAAEPLAGPPVDLTLVPALGISDFDGDGLLDIFTGNVSANYFGLRVHRGDGSGGFLPFEDLFLGVGLGAAAIRDLDGDGLAELLVARSDAPDLVVFPGTGPGQVAAPREVPLPAAPRDLIPFDFDRDGIADLAVLSSTSIHLASAAPGGGFQPALDRELPGGAFQTLAGGDFTGDGEPDLAIADLASRRAIIAAVDRAGAVAKVSERGIGQLAWRLAPLEFDGDGHLDLAVADQVSPEVVLLPRPGTGQPAASLRLAVGSGQSALEAADLDGDGVADVVVATRGGLTLFFGDGRGGFPTSRRIETVKGATDLRAADANRDGSVDLVAAVGKEVVILHAPGSPGEPRAETVSAPLEVRSLETHEPGAGEGLRLVLLGPNAILEAPLLAGGALGPLASYPVGFLLRGLAVADLDGDDLPDCATGNFGSQSVAVLLGQSGMDVPRLRRGDPDLDGRASLTDVVVVVDRLFRGGQALACEDAADANDDGRLDLTDPVFLLVHLFQGGAAPPSPGPKACGGDPTADGLDRCAATCR
jgi:hypothetical protein